MGNVGHEDYSDIKSKLVTEICNISSISNNYYNNGCVHIHNTNIRQRNQNPSKPSSHFIDWYRLLGVEENAGIDVIRRKYHKLALQLHPDKNKHPKADIAFKLVSEAHSCLSDNAKRRAFDLERWKNFCFQCNAVPMPSSSSSNAPKQKACSAPSKSKSHRFLKSLKDIRDKFREETRVIEKCLKTKPVNVSTSPKEEESSPATAPHLASRPDRLFRSVSHKESPVFNPTDYAFDGYPHVRSRVQKKPENFWYLQAGNLLKYERGQGKCDSPIYEIRSDSRAVFKSKSTCVRS